MSALRAWWVHRRRRRRAAASRPSPPSPSPSPPLLSRLPVDPATVAAAVAAMPRLALEQPVRVRVPPRPAPVESLPAPVAPPRETTTGIWVGDQEVDVSKQQDLGSVLDAFCRCVDGVRGAVLATRDGLTVASTLPADRSHRVAAMAATVQALAEQTVPPTEGAGGGHTVVRASEGCLVVHPAGDLAVLAVQTTSRPNIGLVQVQAPEAAGELARLLG